MSRLEVLSYEAMQLGGLYYFQSGMRISRKKTVYDFPVGKSTGRGDSHQWPAIQEG